MKTVTCTSLFVSLLFFAMPLDASAQDEEVLYNEKQISQVDGWTLTSISRKGEANMQHAMIERSYDDGAALRYFLGTNLSTFMFYDSAALKVFTNDVYNAPIVYSFSGEKGAKTKEFKATAGGGDGLTNSQDAYIRTDVGKNPEFMKMLATSNSLNLRTGKYSRKFDLTGSGKAAVALRKLVGAAPSTGATKPPAGATAGPKAGSDAEGEKIVLAADTPSVVWDLTLKGGESKVYQIQGKKGQNMKLSFIEDTRAGQMDLGRASVEEGLENGATLEFNENGFKRVDVSNPSDKRMDFRIYLNVE